jgi:hypothetical protein
MMRDEQQQGWNLEESCGLNQEAIQQLFHMQPDNQLTPVEMTRRAIFPRWEILQPAEYNPVEAENRMLQDIMQSATLFGKDNDHPIH